MQINRVETRTTSELTKKGEHDALQQRSFTRQQVVMSTEHRFSLIRKDTRDPYLSTSTCLVGHVATIRICKPIHGIALHPSNVSLRIDNSSFLLLKCENSEEMETLYTGAIHGFPQSNGGLANGISTGIASSFDQDGVLSLIVVLGGSLSLVALVFAFITYSLFSDLRSLAGTTLMNLLAALFMVQLLFIVGVGGVQILDGSQLECDILPGTLRRLRFTRPPSEYSLNTEIRDSELCISLGLSLQYLRMTVVCWLAAMCHHLYATVASIPRRDDPPTYLKYSLFAWGAPFLNLAVATFLQIYETSSIWNIADLTPFNCWFLGTRTTIYAYGVPVALLLLSAGYYLIKAAIVSRYTCSMQLEIKQREKMKRRRALQMILFLKVCMIVGLVAGCGVASRVWKVPFLWAVFCTGHSLQGLAVALSVACNCRVLKVYARKSYKQPKQQIAHSGSSSMQLLAPAPDPV
ncbi:hypothetical protein ANTQUA_LOCUS8351 [Anthophora quadrimaculata]